MKKKKLACLVAVIALCVVSAVAFAGCSVTNIDHSWKEKSVYDVSLPDFDTLNFGVDQANSDGWYTVFIDNFEGTALNQNITGAPEVENKSIWTTSPHAMRAKTNIEGKDQFTSYWCPDMVTVKDGFVEIRTKESTSHVCSQGICPSSGRFTGGIETRALVNAENNKGTEDDLLFAQAYGYFETRVKFPNEEGLWSAFWLQSSNQRKVGNEGVDGTEIDVYESSFVKNPSVMGHALLWDGYGDYAKVVDARLDTGKNLYDGYHTFGLKWTPNYYIFYIDGVPTWGTMGGGVSKVKEFLRLTVEVDNGDGWGPHGQKIGQYKQEDSVFCVDYVKVYQNKNYLPFVLSDEVFIGALDGKN